MNDPHFIILADKGNLRAYKVERPEGRRPSPKLLRTMEITEAHGRFAQHYTDQAGAFPAGMGGTTNSIAERTGLVIEIDLRCIREIARQINELLREFDPPHWSFAAPAEINASILSHLESCWRDRIRHNVKSDLVNEKPEVLLDHFA